MASFFFFFCFTLCCFVFGHGFSAKLKTVINTLRKREYNLFKIAEVKPETLLCSHNPPQGSTLWFILSWWLILSQDEKIYISVQTMHRPTMTLLENHQITHTEYTSAQTLHSTFPYLFFPTLHSTSNGSIAEWRTRGRRLWSIFFLILSFQIKGWFVFKLTKSSNGPRQRANTLKCLSRSICVMGQSSVSVCVSVRPMW